MNMVEIYKGVRGDFTIENAMNFYVNYGVAMVCHNGEPTDFYVEWEGLK